MKISGKEKQFLMVGAGCFVAGIVFAAAVGWGLGLQVGGNRTINVREISGGLPATSSVAVDCTVTKVSVVVAGDSMTGIVKNGATATLLKGYYACNDVVRGDIIAYDFPGAPIVKRVVGMPGDMLSFSAVSGGSQLLINGKPALTAQKQPYVFPTDKTKMLSLYISQDHGVIPSGQYVILGNISGGSEDSIAFGFVSASDFLGKVQLP